MTGREFIGEGSAREEGSGLDNYENELVIKFIKQECGEPSRGVDVQMTWEDHELGSYPVISIVWDDSVTGCPDGYIGKSIEAFEKFALPEEIYKRARERKSPIHELYADMEKWFEPE